MLKNQILPNCPEEYVFETSLPVDGSDLHSIVNMGIEFDSFGEDDDWRGARLPEGWNLLNLSNRLSAVYDNNNNKRIMVYMATPVHMRSHHRFYHGRDMYDKNFDINVRFCVWDRTLSEIQSEQVVFEKNYGVSSAKRDRKVHDHRVNVYAESNDCEKWLNENYPNWSDHLLYWDE